MIKAVFLDRDGVLIENRAEYVREWAHVEIFEEAAAACRRLSEAGYLLLMVTNQSAIGRGILTYNEVKAINDRVIGEFALRGADIEAAYICPHAPDEACDCRKPLPGMLLQGAREHRVDLSKSFMIGDAGTDMEAADAAGAVGIMVRTGRGRTQEAKLSAENRLVWEVVEDLQAATDMILGIPKGAI